MFIGVEEDRVPFTPGHGNGHDLLRQPARGDGGGGLLLGAQREEILIRAGNAEIFRDILRRFRHAVDAVALPHQFIDEAPADGGVIHRISAAERGFRLRHHKRRAAHAFHPAGDQQIGLAGFDGPRRHADRVHAGTAKPVHRGARHGHRQPRQQSRHAGHVAVIFPRLIGAAIDHILDRCPIHSRIALDQRPDRRRA